MNIGISLINLTPILPLKNIPIERMHHDILFLKHETF